MSVSRKSLISSLLAGGLLLSLIGASPANAAPTVALSINGVVISTASISTTPASVSVPADNSVDAVDAVRFFLTSVAAGTTVTVAATNSFIVSSLSTTLNPVKSNDGVTSANYNVGTGTTSEFFAYTRSTGLGTITITNGGSTFIYYIRGTAGPAYTIAYTPNAKPFTSTLVKQSAKVTDVFGNTVAGVTPTLALINLTSTTPTSTNSDGVSEFTLTYPSSAGMSGLSVSIPAVDVVGFDPAVKTISNFIDVTDATGEIATATAALAAEKAARTAEKTASDGALETATAALAAEKAAADKAATDATTAAAALAAEKAAAAAILATATAARATEKAAADKAATDAATAAATALAAEKAARAADKAAADKAATDAATAAATALATATAARATEKAAADKAATDAATAAATTLAAEKAARAADKVTADKALADEKAARAADKAASDKALATLTASVATLTKKVAELKALYNKLAVKFKQKTIN
jgi:trimeric autotransporter adhesin